MNIHRLLLALVITAASLVTAAERKPNLLLIVSDDVGWAEFGFQGNREIPTPHIDRIAANGIRFTQGYVSGTYCSPTRAGLMTGRYQTRFGHEYNGGGPSFGLPMTEKTMADRLKAIGYATALVGKWHLGDQPHNRPTKRGFDEFYGTLANTSFYRPRLFVDSRVSDAAADRSDQHGYTTEAFGNRAVDWIDRVKDRPWFLYLAFNAQHAPLEAPPEYLARFTHIADEKRRTFAAMMACMDDNVGKVMAKVRALGQEENTLVVFFSDNGGPTPVTTSRNDPLRGLKSHTWEGGVRVPFAIQWKGRLPAGRGYEQPIIQLDLLPTFFAAAGARVDPAWQLDGVHLLPYLENKDTRRPHETLYWRMGAQWAVRHGDWKLVVGQGGGNKPWLIDLTKDIAEANDLSAERPDKVKELQALYDAWNVQQEKARWLPSDNPEKAGKTKGPKAAQKAK
jgi:arylsulfatase A-like enzyme